MNNDLSTQLPNPPELQPIPSTMAKIWQIVSTFLMLGGLALIGIGGWMFLQQQIEARKPPPARIVELSVDDLDNINYLVEEEPDPQPTPTQARPTFVAVRDRLGDTLKSPVSNSKSPEATPTFTLTPTPEPTASPTPEPTDIPTITPTPTAWYGFDPELILRDGRDITMQAPVSTATPISPTVTITQTLANDDSSLQPVQSVQPAAAGVEETEATAAITAPIQASPEPSAEPEDTLSLADNPLVVVQEEAAPAEAEPATAGNEETTGAAAAEAPLLNRIVAESIELDVKVIEVGWQQIVQDGLTANAWIVADYAAGWHQNSALPGQDGNIVLSGHHNIKGEVFRYIVDLEPGDIVSLYDTAGQAHEYIIEDKFIVKDKGEPEAIRRANARWIEPFNEERLTLVTCWPYNNNTHRVIVIGKPAR